MLLRRCHLQRRIIISLRHISQRVILLLRLLVGDSAHVLLSLVHLGCGIGLIVNILPSLSLTLPSRESVSNSGSYGSLLHVEFGCSHLSISLFFILFSLLVDDRPGFSLRRLYASTSMFFDKLLMQVGSLLAHFWRCYVDQCSFICLESFNCCFLLSLTLLGFFLLFRAIEVLIVIALIIVVRDHVANLSSFETTYVFGTFNN